MRKRMLGILLTLCMVLMLVPATVFADEDDTSALQNLLNGGGTVTLEKDYTITSTLEVNNTVNLDLNGHVIKMTTGEISVIKVNSSGNLTLQDSDSDAGHDGTSFPAGGVITGGKIPYGDGGGVFVDGGSFTMAGGTISDCYSGRGGGVYVDGGNFTMTGGAIYDCTSGGDGGGVCVQNNGSFEMTGGAISTCGSGGTGGGGVHVNNGSFTMSDGVISGCHAHAGGGVCAYTNGNFTMNGGTISGCNSTSGGGVFVAGSFTMNGGAITDCSSDSAGGIELAMNSSFTMNGGTISDCSGSESGAAIAFPDATIFANGGTIMDEVKLYNSNIKNTATYGGTVFYGGISIERDGTIIGKKVTFKKDDNTYAIEIVAEGSKAAKPIEPTKEDYEFAGWYDENDTKYDFTGDVTQEIVLTAQWEGKEAPVIKGLEKNKTYCDAVEFEVTDNVGVASVEAGDVELSLGTNVKYTLEKGIGTVKVVATDKSGNTADVTVTVNNGHTWNNGVCSVCNDTCVHKDDSPKDHECDICGKTLSGHTYEWQSENGKYWKTCQICGEGTAKKDIPVITIDGADQICATQEYKFSFTLPEGAANPVYGYDFTTKGEGGLDAVSENNKWYGVVAAEWFDLKQNSFKVYAGATTADGFEFSVEKTVALRSEHTDAEPQDHLCDICGAAISGHSLDKIPTKAATVTETGNKEYWQCKDCEKYFSDADGKNEIADLEAWKAGAGRIDKLSPEIIDGKGQSVTEGEKKALSFRSNAAIADFIRVEVDSKPLYKDDYTLKEGSTIVTLTADYVSKLSAGEHTLSIVSAGGTASTTFTVHVKTAANNTVKAGDNSNLTLWFVLLAASAAGVIGTGVYSQKKKRSAK